MLYLDPSTIAKDKVEKMRALHSKWLYKNTKKVVEGVKLAAR